jgi:hypothetical protein
MSMMNLPGFTAEASLYKSMRQYRRTGNLSAFARGRGVLPQLPIGFCMADCDFNETDPLSNAVCKFGCLDQQDGGSVGGPGNPICRPSCTRCHTVPGQPGRWKTCIDRKCDDREVRCS